jgi:hypothetical protein
MVWNNLGWVNCKGLNIQVRVVNYEKILLLSVIIKLLIRQPQKTEKREPFVKGGYRPCSNFLSLFM